MRIAIIGTGGVGGYFGGRLAKAGNDVVFVARGEHRKVMLQNGLKVKSILGDFLVQPVQVVEHITQIGTADLVLVCVKAWQVKGLAKEISGILQEHTVVVPLQNGVLAVGELMAFVPEKNIMGGLCKMITKVEAPGVINHFGVDPVLIFGELSGQMSHRAKKIQNIMTGAGIRALVAEDITAELWKKFIAICVGGVLAVSRCNYGKARETKETRQQMLDIMDEVYHVAQKKGIVMEQDIVAKTMGFIDTFEYDSTASLARDIWEGKPSEIDYQNGAVVKMGEEVGVDTPANKYIYDRILSFLK